MELLPWYLNQTLEASERQAVEVHLEKCARCRDEVGFLETVQSSARVVNQAAIRDRFDELLARIDRPKLVAIRASPLVRWLVVGQAAAIAALLAVLLWPAASGAPGSYQTMSDRGRAEPTDAVVLRVMFDEQATEVELRVLLESIDAQIVAGPNSAGAYTLRLGREAVEGRTLTNLLERLRGDPLIRFAESVVVAP
jgi:anti-sigma factor RsiW